MAKDGRFRRPPAASEIAISRENQIRVRSRLFGTEFSNVSGDSVVRANLRVCLVVSKIAISVPNQFRVAGPGFRPEAPLRPHPQVLPDYVRRTHEWQGSLEQDSGEPADVQIEREWWESALRCFMTEG